MPVTKNKNISDVFGWKEIETAPLDGTPILLALASPLSSNDVESFVPWDEISVVIGWWDSPSWHLCFMEHGAADSWGQSNNFYIGALGLRMEMRPTHWCMLPNMPDTAPMKR